MGRRSRPALKESQIGGRLARTGGLVPWRQERAAFRTLFAMTLLGFEEALLEIDSWF